MKRLLMSTAIVGLAALPGFAIAQSDQGSDTQTSGSMTQEQSGSDKAAGTSADAEAGAKAGTDSDMEDGAQSGTDSGSDTDMGASSQSGSDSDMGSSSQTGSDSDMNKTSQTGSDDSDSKGSMSDSDASSDMDSSDMESGSGSDDMMSNDRPSVAEGHSEVDPTTVEASEVEGASVMSRDDEDIADVSEVLLTEDGSIESIVVNVGGVLGIGSKPVAVPFDKVTLQTNDDDGEMSIVIPMSQQELEDMPEYEED